MHATIRYIAGTAIGIGGAALIGWHWGYWDVAAGAALIALAVVERAIAGNSDE